MKLNSLVMYHVKKILGMSKDDAKNYLTDNGFSRIGHGEESIVYSRKGFEYVIKIQYEAFHNSGTNADEVPSDKHFVPTMVFRGDKFNIIVQKKCDDRRVDYFDKRYQKFQRFVRDKFSVSDIHEKNVGLIKGRMYVFDWNYC
jgi:hypothetical protein